MALKPHSKRRLPAAGVGLEAAGGRRAPGVCLIADADGPGDKLSGACRVHGNTAHRQRKLIERYGRILRQQGKGFPVVAVQGGKIQFGPLVTAGKPEEKAGIKKEELQKEGQEKSTKQKHTCICLF